MPCDTISTVTVALGTVDMDLLERALRALAADKTSVIRYSHTPNTLFFNYGESFNKATGELKLRDAATVAQIKRAYSAEVVKSQAKRYGWTLKETAPYTYAVIKR